MVVAKKLVVAKSIAYSFFYKGFKFQANNRK
jgi:hypothetical protein